MSAWVDKLNETLEVVSTNSQNYIAEIEYDEERHIYRVLIKVFSHGLKTEYRLKQTYFSGSDYNHIRKLGEMLIGLIEEGAYVTRGDKKQEVTSFEDMLAWLMKEARRGYTTQRYKGLGEMNPEQLWETTMDPEGRRMLQVTIEDAIAADQSFTTLMGDDVEPRRAFIEANALNVENLDF